MPAHRRPAIGKKELIERAIVLHSGEVDERTVREAKVHARESRGGLKFRCLCKELSVRMVDGETYTIRRGQVVYLEDVEPGSAVTASFIYGPRDGSADLEKLIAHERHEIRNARGQWSGVAEPAWYRSKIIPAWEPCD